MKNFFIVFSIVVMVVLSGTATLALTADNRTPAKFTGEQAAQYQKLRTNTSNFFSSANSSFSVPNFLFGKSLFKLSPAVATALN